GWCLRYRSGSAWAYGNCVQDGGDFTQVSAGSDGAIWSASLPDWVGVGPNNWILWEGYLVRPESPPLFHTGGAGGGGFVPVSAVSANSAWACAGEYEDEPSPPTRTFLYHTDGSSGQPHYTVPCTTLAADASEVVWVGSPSGLRRFDGQVTATYTAASSPLPS